MRTRRDYRRWRRDRRGRRLGRGSRSSVRHARANRTPTLVNTSNNQVRSRQNAFATCVKRAYVSRRNDGRNGRLGRGGYRGRLALARFLNVNAASIRGRPAQTNATHIVAAPIVEPGRITIQITRGIAFRSVPANPQVAAASTSRKMPENQAELPVVVNLVAHDSARSAYRHVNANLSVATRVVAGNNHSVGHSHHNTFAVARCGVILYKNILVRAVNVNASIETAYVAASNLHVASIPRALLVVNPYARALAVPARNRVALTIESNAASQNLYATRVTVRKAA